MLVSLILTVAALVLSCFGPGFFLVRRTNWGVEEKVTVSIALSLFFVYVTSFLVFSLRLPAAFHGGILFLCLFLTFASGTHLVTFLKARETRILLGWFGVLCLWVLVPLGLIRNYSGATWYLDWFEHFRRSLFFMGGQPYDLVMEMNYTIPSRPPLMNVLCAHFLALRSTEYPTYQIISTFLSVLVYFPACLLANWFSAKGRFRPMLVAAFLMFNPMFVQNATYSWTKLLAAFYVLTGLSFYLTSAGTEEWLRILVAFTSLSAAFLTHYSAGPYALFLGLHFLFVRFRPTRRGWAVLAAIAGSVAIVLLTWFGWSMSIYGVRKTFEATSTVRDTARLSAVDNVAKVATNVWNTLVPPVLRGADPAAEGASFWAILRDRAFKHYQSSLLFGMGIFGWALLLSTLGHLRRVRSRGRVPEQRFWVGFVIFSVLVGIAVHGEEDRYGLAHICLQPLIVVGLAFLAASFDAWSRPVRYLALCGLMCDALAGILLHVRFESVPFDAAPLRPGPWQIGKRDLLLGSAQMNWGLKTKEGLEYLGDLLYPQAGALWFVAGVILCSVLYLLAREARNNAVQDLIPGKVTGRVPGGKRTTPRK
jgi:hypothetical protein